jgi:acetyltransferase-like isoleucine patch superfamily enzyme
MRILGQIFNQINSYSSYRDSPILIERIEDFQLFDGNDIRFSGIGDKNFLFVHKNANVPSDCIHLEGSGNVVVISSGVSLTKSKILAIGKNGLVFLGPNVRMTKCSVRLASRGNCFSVGENTSWESGNASVMEDEIYLAIGSGCMFSSNIEMMTSDKHPIFDRTTGERLNKPSSIIIEDNVWLGRSVKVGKGVHIKHDCIIGQGSLVTKSTKPYCAYAGVPARLIRENVEWRRSLKTKTIDPSQTNLS